MDTFLTKICVREHSFHVIKNGFHVGKIEKSHWLSKFANIVFMWSKVGFVSRCMISMHFKSGNLARAATPANALRWRGTHHRFHPHWITFEFSCKLFETESDLDIITKLRNSSLDKRWVSQKCSDIDMLQCTVVYIWI